MPELPPEVPLETKPSVKCERGALKGIKAVIYVAVMLLVYLSFCYYMVHAGNRNAAEVNGQFFGFQLRIAVAVYIVSTFLPARWVTNLRAFFLSLSINGGMAFAIIYAVYGRG